VPTCEARLSFGVAPPEQLREAVRRLARAAEAAEGVKHAPRLASAAP
jgi:hypothetical protein